MEEIKLNVSVDSKRAAVEIKKLTKLTLTADKALKKLWAQIEKLKNTHVLVNVSEKK